MEEQQGTLHAALDQTAIARGARHLAADKRALAALMRRLKQVDPRRTVIMVQVENEPGTWSAVRDDSEAAQKPFEAPPPSELLRAMHKEPGATWQGAFGA